MQHCFTSSHFCFTSGIAKATCNTLLYDCTGDGAKRPCNPENVIYSCTTGYFKTGGVDLATGYIPLNTERPPESGWVAALATARAGDYHFSGGANRIGAAYAYARGHTGTGITVSVVRNSSIDREHEDLSGQWVSGYVANEEDSSGNAGTCLGTGPVNGGGCGTADDDPSPESSRKVRKLSTHIATIVAGKSANGGVQGIAYNAKIKPIEIYITGETHATSNAKIAHRNSPTSANLRAVYQAYEPFREKRAKAIEQASGPNIAVMLNDWHIDFPDSFNINSGPRRGNYYYTKHVSFVGPTAAGKHKRLGVSEVRAWSEAAKTTVLVFGAGDHGYNSETGRIKLYGDLELSENLPDFTSISNLAGSYRTLPTLVPAIQGKSLFVVALDGNDKIWKYSNGCGTTKNWCLGAPGVNINSAIPGDGEAAYSVYSGTGQAAAHVAGGVAVLKSAFPHLTPDQLVSVILYTADDLGAPGVDDIYGYGRLNLARATEPVGHRRIVLPRPSPIICGNPLILDCATGFYVTGGVDSVTRYEPSNTEPPPAVGWVAALRNVRTTEYRASTEGAADQIGAAYAHARGYTGINKNTGNSVIVSNVGTGRVLRDHKELEGQLVQGYVASNNNRHEHAATCIPAGFGLNGNSGECDIASTHTAGIIAGKKGNGGIQGIAYNAKIKPISIYGSDGGLTTSAKRANAIAEASGSNIAVMNNNWHVQSVSSFHDYSSGRAETVYYRFQNTFRRPTSIGGRPQDILDVAEVAAWAKAAETTVLVFAAGDGGRNSETGRQKNYTDETLSTRTTDSPTNRGNSAGSYSTLPILVPAVQGKILSVIALDGNNRIHKYSNGCGGNTKDWCLGAPGVAIYSSISSSSNSNSYGRETGPAQAGAHVSAAVAVLKGAFPHLTPAELVAIILNTADYIPKNYTDTKTDGTNHVYGHGKLNLARATEPLGSRMTASAVMRVSRDWYYPR